MTENLFLEGVVRSHLGKGGFQVDIDGHIINCKRSRWLEKNHIAVKPKDRVRVEISPHDLSLGIIKYRFKK
jgi:translation initiation factor IF-1